MNAQARTGGLVAFDQVHLPTLLVPVGPFYIGWVLAAEALLPRDATFWVAFLSVLPFLGVGTLLVNDIFDIEVDSLSARKAAYAHTRGGRSPRGLMTLALASFGACLVLASLVSAHFLAVVALLVLLALLYSVPPIALTRRPGLDLLANALGIGVLCTIAGWVVEAPGELPPLAWLVTSALGTGTFFIVPTLMDMESDRDGGKESVAVWLGWRRACYLGLALITLADVGIVYMSLSSIVLKPSFLYVAWVVILGEVLVFPILARRRELVRPLGGAMALLLLVGNLLIILSYVGALGPF